LASKIKEAIRQAATLSTRLALAGSNSEVNEIKKKWYAEVEASGDKQLADLALLYLSSIQQASAAALTTLAESQIVRIIAGGDVHMGDQYNAGQAGAMGPGAKAQNIQFSQLWIQAQKDVNLAALPAELATLRAEMKRRGDGSVAHDRAIADVGAAEEAAKAGDGEKTMGLLKSAGVFALGVAKDIAADVAATVIKSSMGMA
jgi:hypothetical protein